MQGGHPLHTCTSSHPKEFPMVKALLLVNASHNSQSLKDDLMCTMKDLGASKKTYHLKQENKT